MYSYCFLSAFGISSVYFFGVYESYFVYYLLSGDQQFRQKYDCQVNKQLWQPLLPLTLSSFGLRHPEVSGFYEKQIHFQQYQRRTKTFLSTRELKMWSVAGQWRSTEIPLKCL